MTLALTPLPTVDLSTVDLFRISVEQYHAMIEAEILTTSDRVELLEGVLVYKMSKDESHVVAEESVSDAVEKQLPNTFSYRSQNPITLPDGEPEPDGAVVRGDRRTYLREGRKPGAADTFLPERLQSGVLSAATSFAGRQAGRQRR
ncbi:MAG: Uma2 family endonuclease, partial [Burkholderiales bacterium]|nr:Uma2 family endonuclease [Phycisphaerae bacterium]